MGLGSGAQRNQTTELAGACAVAGAAALQSGEEQGGEMVIPPEETDRAVKGGAWRRPTSGRVIEGSLLNDPNEM